MYICLYLINWVASSASSAPFVLINPPSLLRYGHPQEEYEHKFKSGIEIYIHKRTTLFLISWLATNRPAEIANKIAWNILIAWNSHETPPSQIQLTRSSHQCVYRNTNQLNIHGMLIKSSLPGRHRVGNAPQTMNMRVILGFEILHIGW
jgi:hypothetical protein